MNRVPVPLTFIMILMVLMGGCSMNRQPSGDIGPPPGQLVEITVEPTTIEAAAGEQIQFAVILTNVSERQVTVSALPPLIRIWQEGQDIEITRFPSGSKTETLGAGDHTTIMVTWDQTADNKQVDTGSYVVSVDDLHVVCEDGRSTTVGASAVATIAIHSASP